jgi:Flp pilus assembly protein TadG
MSRQRSRRGANTIEFALLAPVFIALLGGLVDYGWYFWNEALLVNGLRESVRSGALKSQDEGESGMTCAPCVSAASSAAASELEEQGYDITVTPYLQRIPESGTPCTYAVVIDATIPHTRLFELVPGPSDFEIRVLSMAQNLTCE